MNRFFNENEILGAEYAEQCFNDGCTDLVEYERELCSMPDGDYNDLIERGITPNDRQYWSGYNQKMLQLIENNETAE